MSLKLQVDLPRQDVTVGQFFQDLSAKDGLVFGRGFNRRFHIDRNPIAQNGKLFTITEQVRPWNYHPLRVFMRPAAVKERVSDTANLVALIKREAETVVKLPNVNIKRVTAVFDRMAESMTRNVPAAAAQKIRDNLCEASRLLRVEAIKHDIAVDGTSWRTGREMRVGPFIKKLSSSWPWPFGFNSRFHVVESNKAARFNVYVDGKPWFFQKMFRWPEEFTTWKIWQDMKPLPVSGSAKVATAEKLAEMITHERELIRSMRPNVPKMVSNLERIKASIVRNTNPSEREKIETAFNKAINELKKLGHLVLKDQNNSWTRWVWNRTAAPLGRVALASGRGALAGATLTAKFFHRLIK